jgi:hypothetical protein
MLGGNTNIGNVMEKTLAVVGVPTNNHRYT